MRKRTYQTQTWEEWYECAKNYYSKFGDLLISRDFVTADGFRLGRWIERQRGMYNGVLPSSLHKAVSHTHLDVYKRQELNTMPSSMPVNGWNSRGCA